MTGTAGKIVETGGAGDASTSRLPAEARGRGVDVAKGSNPIAPQESLAAMIEQMREWARAKYGPLLMDCVAEYVADIKRREWSPNTIVRYERELERFADFVGAGTPIAKVDKGHCRGFLDSFTTHSPNTIQLEWTILNSFWRFLVVDDVVDVNPMDKVRRPKSVEAKRTRISTADVVRLLAECQTWQETLTLYVLAFTGARRHAVSELRWRDVDMERGTLAFFEKGRKRALKPIADELRGVLEDYLATHSPAPDDFVIPNKRPTGKATRSDRIVYSTVKDVARRAGVTTHVHSLRAAFAVAFLERNPERLMDLKELMGHSSVATTDKSYLGEYNKQQAMKSVLDLSFAGEAELGESA